MTTPRTRPRDCAQGRSNGATVARCRRPLHSGVWCQGVLVGVALLLGVPRAAGQLERETWWTSVEGVTIWAHLVGCDEGHVILLRNGRDYRVPLHRLAPQSVLKARKMLGLAAPRDMVVAATPQERQAPGRKPAQRADAGVRQAQPAPKESTGQWIVSAAPAVAGEDGSDTTLQPAASARCGAPSGGPGAGIELCGPPVLAGGGGWKVPWEDRLEDSSIAPAGECPLPKASLPVDPGAAGYAAVLPPRDSLPLPAPQLPLDPPPGAEIRLVGRVARGSAQLPSVVQVVIAAANRLQDKPYRWGGGHGRVDDSGYDCSGSVSYVLIKAGLLSSPLPSSGFTRYGLPGRGRWITIYARNGHAFMTICGLRLDTGGSRGRGESGPRWRLDGRGGAGFVMRHPPGL